jgi:hypothetical protein
MYLWVVEDEMYGGTLQQWANNNESGYYHGIDVPEPSAVVVEDGEPVLRTVNLVSESSVSDDHRRVDWTDSDRGDTATQRFDLRA